MKKKLLEILNDACPGIDFENEKAMIDDGVLESLDIVIIVTELKAEYDIDINVEDLKPENFNSLDGIINLLKSRGVK